MQDTHAYVTVHPIMYRVFFLRVTSFVSLPKSLCETYDAVIFRGYSGHFEILCGIVENAFEFLFADQKLKKLEKSKFLVNMTRFSSMSE